MIAPLTSLWLYYQWSLTFLVTDSQATPPGLLTIPQSCNLSMSSGFPIQSIPQLILLWINLICNAHCKLPLLDFTCSSVHQPHGSGPPHPSCRLQLMTSILSYLYHAQGTPKIWSTNTSHSNLQFVSGEVKNGKKHNKSPEKYKHFPGLTSLAKWNITSAVIIFEGC